MLLYNPNLILVKALKLNSISSSVWKLDWYNQDHGMSMWDRNDAHRCDCLRDLDINGAFKFQMLGNLNVVLKGSEQELLPVGSLDDNVCWSLLPTQTKGAFLQLLSTNQDVFSCSDHCMALFKLKCNLFPDSYSLCCAILSQFWTIMQALTLSWQVVPCI